MLNLRNATVTLVGRPDRASRKSIRAALALEGGRLASTITSRCRAIAVSHGAVPLVRSGRLQPLIATADDRRISVISEHELLRRLRLLPPAAVEDRAFSASDLSRQSALREECVRILACFDVIEEVDGRFGFRDLVTARIAAELVVRGAQLAAIVEAGLQLRRLSGYRADLSRYRLTLAADGSVLILQDGQPVEPGGQMRLPLELEPASAFEDVADAAEQAEDEGDIAAAERLYRQALQIRRHDVVSLANLANILIGRDARKEASALLVRAVAADPSYADAWYNLAHIAQHDGDYAATRRYLERAVEARPDYADAIYNLAHLHFVAEEYDRAEPLWQRYLVLDRGSKWAQTARRALKVCEMARTHMSA